MLSVELTNLADILDSAKQSRNVSTAARTWSARIHDAIWNTTVGDASVQCQIGKVDRLLRL